VGGALLAFIVMTFTGYFIFRAGRVAERERLMEEDDEEEVEEEVLVEEEEEEGVTD